MNTPWYKEPWAWLVFFLPFSAVVAGIGTVIIANTDADTLVAGDYYKKGKAINLELSKIKRAQKLGHRFDLKLTDNTLIIKPTGIERNFPILKVSLFHPTLETNDIELTLTANGNGNFRHQFEQVIDGKWKLTLSSFGDDWKIQQNISLPQSNYVAVIADPSGGN
jgi:hypothetical protein